MSDSTSNAINVAALMQEIRVEVARRRARPLQSAPDSLAPADGDIERRSSYTISDLSSYDGERFVRNAYLAILRREPDPQGSATFLRDLRAGRRSKVEIIHVLRYSAEGCAAGVSIRGLRETALQGPGMSKQLEAGGRIERRTSYHVKEFLSFHDYDFVRNAYVSILLREPGTTEVSHLLEQLRRGQIVKVDVLASLRYSSEGRAAGVQIRGLLQRRLIRAFRRVPMAGRILNTLQCIVRLPNSFANQERLEAAVFHHRRELIDAHTTLAKRQESNARNLENLSGELASARQMALLARRVDSVDAALKPLVERANEFATISSVAELQWKIESALHDAVTRPEYARLVEAVQQKVDLEVLDAIRQHGKTSTDETRASLDLLHGQIVECKRNIFDQREILGQILDEARAAGQSVYPRSAERAISRPDHVLDEFYSSFEDKFRGTAKEIKERAEVYLPIVREAGAGTVDRPILDIGCGRGEWLGLLRDSGLTACGVDLNRVMVDSCRRQSLEVFEGDALEYLRTLQSNSLGAVTGMHIIEHLPFPKLIGLLDEAFRVLIPGGVAILETPNPENLMVGACGFWADPTHLRPIVPETANFILEARGFVGGRILRLNPATVEARLPDSMDPMWGRLNHLMYGPRDYSIVAFKRNHHVAA